jgi:outer membrane receptor for ferrienterochelin and colicin
MTMATAARLVWAALLAAGMAVTSPRPALAAAPEAPQSGTPAPGTVRGVVVDAQTEQPLARVLVRLADTPHAATTGSDGRFALTGVAPGAYTLTVSVEGFALVRKAVAVTPAAVLDFTVVLTAGTGTYEERVDVVAPVFATREPGTVAESTLSALESQDLRSMVADDPLRAVQAMPAVTATDDFTAEFAARGSGPGSTNVVLDGVPAAAVLLHTVEGRDDSGSIARINGDVLDRTTLLLGSFPQRYGDRLGPELEFVSRDGSRDGFHLRAVASTVAAAALAEGPLAGARGAWLASFRQSYLDRVIKRLDAAGNTTLGFTDAFGKLVFDVTPRQQVSLTVLGGRANYDERTDTPGPNTLSNAVSRGGLAIGAWRAAGASWLVSQRGFFLLNRFQNLRADGLELGQGRHTEWGWRGDASRVVSGRLTLEFGGHAQRTLERVALWSYDRRVPPRRTATEQYDRGATSGGAFLNVRWQPSPAWTLAAGGRADATTAVSGATGSPWIQVQHALPSGLSVRAGAALAHQAPSFEQIWGVTSGGGSALGPQRSIQTDVGVDQTLGARTRWQVSIYNRREQDVVFASGLEPRAAGAPIPYDPRAKYANRLSGFARGVELLLQRRDPNGVSGWVAYAYSRSRYTDDVTGERFDGDYDQRHTLNTYVSVRLWSRTAAIVKFRAGSNIPVRGYYRATGAEDADGLPVFVAGPYRNEGRLPTYARLDARLNQVFNFSTRRLTLFVELINVLDRTNGGMGGGRRVEKLLPFVPAAGLLMEF